MQEETTSKTINLCIKGGHISSSILKVAMRKYLGYLGEQMKRDENRREVQKTERLKVEARAKAEKKVEARRPHGKQSMKNLMNYGDQLTNIKITDKNIKSFDRIARKYNIDYSLKKDNSVTPPNYLVFFKAKDVDVMKAAFQEYAGISVTKAKRPSLRKKLVKAIGNVSQQRQKHRTREKDRGPSR